MSVDAAATVGSSALADLRKIAFLAVPAMLALITQTAINTVDTWFIGQLQEPERSDGQAMLSFSLALLWAIGGFLCAISVGTQAMTARREGAGESRDAGAVLANAIVVAVASSIVLYAVSRFIVPPIFEFASNDPDYIRIGVNYTEWRFVGLVSMVVTAAYKAFYDGTSRTYVHFFAAVVMNIVNVLLCWALIFGNWGAPHLGVEGAGIAAAVSSWVGVLVMIAFSLRRADLSTYAVYRRGVLAGELMWRLVRLSIPSGVATTVVMTGFIVFIQIVNLFDQAHAELGGAEAVNGAATTIIIQVLSLTFFSCLAFGVATATLVSQSLGAKDPDSAERYAWNSVKLGAVFFGVIGVLEMVWAERMIALFNESPLVIAAGASSLRLMGACGPLIATGMILTQALFGAGNPRFVMIAELLLHFGVLLPLSYLLGIVFDFGLFGVWSSAAIYVFLLTVIMSVKFRGGSWKAIAI